GTTVVAHKQQSVNRLLYKVTSHIPDTFFSLK
nr:RecName: Full=Hemocyanin subunit 1 [Homarus americanus]